MKPFLFITTRDTEAAAMADYASFCRYAGLEPNQLHLVRLDRQSMPKFELEEYSGIILGGSPLNASDIDKSSEQQRIEAELDELVGRVLDADFPFLGACFGIGILGLHLGAIIDGTYGEPVSAPRISLTDEGKVDPLLQHLPDQFHAYVGHKEAMTTVPEQAVVLASSASCPVQMFRLGCNVYATQFHPELDIDALTARVHAYLGHGYIDPAEAENVLAELRGVEVSPAHSVLAGFIDAYRAAKVVS